MNARERIATIRLAEKLDRNRGFAKELGVSVITKHTVSKSIVQNEKNDFCNEKG